VWKPSQAQCIGRLFSAPVGFCIPGAPIRSASHSKPGLPPGLRCGHPGRSSLPIASPPIALALVLVVVLELLAEGMRRFRRRSLSPIGGISFSKRRSSASQQLQNLAGRMAPSDHRAMGSICWNPHPPPSRKGAPETFFLRQTVLFREIDNFWFFQGSFSEEFKIPDRLRDDRRRHRYRGSTALRGALNGPLCSEDLVIKEVSVEILTSRIERNSLGGIWEHHEQTGCKNE
jgi:hypothetical protein